MSAMAAFFSMRADLRLRDDAETSGIASSLSTRSTKTGAELDAAAPAEPRFGMLWPSKGGVRKRRFTSLSAGAGAGAGAGAEQEQEQKQEQEH